MPGEKTEKASPKRRQDERKKGNIFQSKDITTLVGLVVSFFTLRFFVARFYTQISALFQLQMYRAMYVNAEQRLLFPDVIQIFADVAILVATTALPVMIVVALATIFAVGLQTKWLIAYEQIKFKLERIDPIKGFKKFFSLRKLVELLKSFVKISIVTSILYGRVMQIIEALPVMMNWEPLQGIVYIGNELMAIIISVAIAFGALAILDYIYQWWEYERGIRMSKHEVKDEYKQMEGNPEIKGKRREKQREFAMKRMMAQVKEADVVVRNPTHYAVALKYKLGEDLAPLVKAKGMDNVALKIIEEAEKYGVAVVENRPLARSLYDISNVDDVIPPDFFQPVAELLAWLYSTKEKDKHKR